MLEKKVTDIISSLSFIKNENLFESLLTAMAAVIGSAHLFIGEVDDELTTATSVSHVQGNSLADNFSYELKGTPCENVTANKVCSYNGNVQQQFPDDLLLVAMEIKSYVGIPLVNSDGRIHGILVALFRSEIETEKDVISLLILFSGMISNELERRHSKKQLELSQSVFNHLEEGVIITDAQKRIISANPAFLRIYGFTKEEVLGNDPGALLRSGLQDRAFYENMWDQIGKTGSWSGVIVNKKKNGELHPEWLKINKIREKDSGDIYYVGLYQDTDELKKLEKLLTIEKQVKTTTACK